MDGQAAGDTRPGATRPPTRASSGTSRRPTTCRVIVGVGASLFDDRFGLADRKPSELVTMPFLANDRLDPAVVARRHAADHLEAGHADTVAVTRCAS